MRLYHNFEKTLMWHKIMSEFRYHFPSSASATLHTWPASRLKKYPARPTLAVLRNSTTVSSLSNFPIAATISHVYQITTWGLTWSKSFLLEAQRVPWHIAYYSWLQIQTAERIAPDFQLRAFLQRVFKMPFYLIDSHLIDHRSHSSPVQDVAKFELVLDRLNEFRNKLIVNFCVDHDVVGANTGLPGVPELEQKSHRVLALGPQFFLLSAD